MGSQSDWETMVNAADTLKKLGVAYEAEVVSAAIPLHPETLPNGSIPRTGLTSPPPSDQAAGD